MKKKKSIEFIYYLTIRPQTLPSTDGSSISEETWRCHGSHRWGRAGVELVGRLDVLVREKGRSNGGRGDSERVGRGDGGTTE